MNIKSLLLGSAAALVAVSGARAADAVVIPEPEAVEYVRVCDAAGTGYFFIPGTETCLRFSGYVRYEINYESGDDSWVKRSDIRLNIDAWNDTELGPLFSRLRFESDASPESENDIGLELAYFTIAGLTIGQKNTFWDWGFGADGDGLIDYGPSPTGMIAYTFDAAGFGFTLALEDDGDTSTFMPDVVFDVNGSIGEFGLHAGAAYNQSEEGWTVKAAGSYDFGVAALQLGVQYSNDNILGNEYGAEYTWVIGGDVSFDISEKLSARFGGNYGIDFGGFSGVNDYQIGAGVNYKVVSGFDIDARINYADGDTYADGVWTSRVRLTRSF